MKPAEAVIAVLLAASCNSPPQAPTFITEMLAAHNAARAAALPAPSPALAPLTWSDQAAATAQAWANGCQFSHNPNLVDLGENIAASAPPDHDTPTDVVDGWASEGASYNYAADTCSGICGHYTQVVWRNTTMVGCAKVTCPQSTSPFAGPYDWDLWVCDYDPPGNFIGQRPY